MTLFMHSVERSISSCASASVTISFRCTTPFLRQLHLASQSFQNFVSSATFISGVRRLAPNFLK